VIAGMGLSSIDVAGTPDAAIHIAPPCHRELAERCRAQRTRQPPPRQRRQEEHRAHQRRLACRLPDQVRRSVAGRRTRRQGRQCSCAARPRTACQLAGTKDCGPNRREAGCRCIKRCVPEGIGRLHRRPADPVPRGAAPVRKRFLVETLPRLGEAWRDSTSKCSRNHGTCRCPDVGDSVHEPVHGCGARIHSFCYFA
jgi:hypothetical protein